MRYVKIKARTYNEAMMKLKMEHGDDAIPISHKNIKEGGIFNTGLFARDFVELTAAIPDVKPTRLKPRKNIDLTVGGNENINDLLKQVIDKPENQPQKNPNTGLEQLIAQGMEKSSIKTTEAPHPVKSPVDEVIVERTDQPYIKLEKEFQELKMLLKNMVASGQQKPIDDIVIDSNDIYFKPFKEILRKNDIDDDECNRLLEDVKRNVSSEDMKDRYKIEKTLRELIKSKIIVGGPIDKGKRKKVLMFVGPTAVGKTTTMAKLGAILSLRQGLKVSFITIDNYRIAATEQLKKYAEIMRIPIHVVTDSHEFKEIVENEKAEIIMVDTSGRSHRNDLKIAEIKNFADACNCEIHKILCVSANTKRSDLNEVFKAYDILHIDSIIVTKVDETSYIGNVISIADKYNKPISYFTNGQEVPNDIAVADPEIMVNMILESTMR
ncbi:MAG TPA: flagellar biosynthesis protein FlhF [Spirochaetota bacterium]|nr:flagellar biosynthesis protein FlhF [Spirochaetota bacterium]